MPVSSAFLYVLCQPGAEKALKEELAREYPALRFAYSRSGFVTFRSPQPLQPDFELKSVFARAFGLSLGKVKEGPEAWEKLIRVAQEIVDEVGDAAKPLRLQVDGPDELFAQAPSGLFASDSFPSPGDWIFVVVAVTPGELWYGLHRHSAAHSPFVCGNPRIDLPPHAPSRAYLKLEEAARLWNIPFQKGDVAVEIGSAPGGASLALLERGIRVVGVDPGEMAPIVLGNRDFMHVQRPVAALRREELPASIQWLLLDMNVAPAVTLHQVSRLAGLMKDSLLGVVLTVKLNEWEMAREIPHYLEQIKQMGMIRLRARQLYHNRQEISVYGLTMKGKLRG